MAKTKSKDKYEARHLRNLTAYERQIDDIYREAVKEAASISSLVGGTSGDKAFSFKDYPITQHRVNKLLQGLKNSLYGTIVNAVRSEWTLANNKNNELCNQVFGSNVGMLSEAQYRRYYSTNPKALEAFIARKQQGLNLSDRVWNYTNQFKAEIEMGLDLGLRDGLSADEMSRQLRQYLRYPDKLFRRVRDEHGQLHLSKAAKAFHPGQGVYRSSYKNARRLAATESNIAYRTADYDRYQNLDFVVGIEVHLSNNHTLNGKPFEDICDQLKGRYPKDFKFTGWHPLCRCHVTSVLKTREELFADNERILRGEPVSTESVNSVDDVPQGFNKWLEENEERMKQGRSVPYFMTGNPKYTGVTPKFTGANGYTGTKLGREATKEARREYETALAPILSDMQQRNINEISAALNTTASPMTFDEADNGRANIKFDKRTSYIDNCQSCVVVHEARLRGLDITSLGYTANRESIQFKLGNDSSLAWINPNTGKAPQIDICEKGNDEYKYAWLNKRTEATGRYHIGVNFGNDKGHIFTAERISGRLLLYDPQKNEFLKIEEFVELESIEVLRVDKLLINKDILLGISRLI